MEEDGRGWREDGRGWRERVLSGVEWSGVAERDDLFVVDINTRKSCKHCFGGFIICVGP